MPIQLTPLLVDHAVLQRHQSIPIWGWTDSPRTPVHAKLGNGTAKGVSGDDCRFLLRLPAMAEGGPYSLTVETCDGHEKVVVKDIMIGEVWLASGQSNMQWSMIDCGCDDDIENADPSQIRMFTVERRADLAPQSTVRGKWETSTPATVRQFSAVATFFGNRLQDELDVPVGIVHASWGGTFIETWMSRQRLLMNPEKESWVRAYERNCFTDENWEERKGGVLPADPGNCGVKQNWHDPDYNDEQWKEMDLPCLWQTQGCNFSGVFWFRKRIIVPNDMVGEQLTLSLGAVDKQDITYVNGREVGRTGEELDDSCFARLRKYTIPAELTQTSELVIAVRAYSFVHGGGLTGPAETMKITRTGEEHAEGISITGTWRFNIEHNFGFVDVSLHSMGHEVPNSPYMLFENMIRPMLPLGIAGVIWYQGESNANRGAAAEYKRLMTDLIQDWRYWFGNAELPFIQTQLANYMKPSEHQPGSAWARLREAQLQALELPNTGLAVTIDVGEADNIHPKDKKTVGHRLARWALCQVYGRPGVPGSPLYRGHRVEGQQIRIFFSHADDGLATRDGGRVKSLVICGEDGDFKPAESRIEGSCLVVWHDEIDTPAAVRYAWGDNPEGANLTNTAGFPASPFRTGPRKNRKSA